MKVTPHVHIAATDVCLPSPLEVADTQGERHNQALVMALQSARRCLMSAGVAPADLDLLVHAWVHNQGANNWAPPHRLAHRLGANTCQPVGVQQHCAGGAAAMDIAITRLLVDERVRTALVVTSDDFTEPMRRHPALRSGELTDMADMASGATAVVLTRQPARLAIVASAARGWPAVEPLHTAQLEHRLGRVSSPAAMSSQQVMSAAKALQKAMRLALTEALADAGLTTGDPRIRHLMLPRLHRAALDAVLLPVLPEALRAKSSSLGAETGHLGAGDTAANLHQMLASPPRDGYTVLLSGGMGLTASCLVVRTTDVAA
jgi:3-oxoacyl-[acyl-carrier-protein] synthase-3